MGITTANAKKPVAASNRSKRFSHKWPSFAIPIFFGALLGLCAPGIGLWLYAWFGLAPLLVLIASAKTKWHAALKSVLFGLAYNCVYMSWYLGLAPLDWLGFNDWQSNCMAAAALFCTSFHQALIIGVFAFVCRLLPLKSCLGVEKQSNHLILPSLWTVPFLWVLIVNKLGNLHWLTGVPWSMLEYSQYKQLPLIQIASVIGGLGIGYLIVLVNVAAACLIANIFKIKVGTLLASKRKTAFEQVFLATGILLAVLVYGFWHLSQQRSTASTTLSVVQPGVNIEMQKSEKRYNLNDLLRQQENLLSQCPPGLCIWTEGALPTRLTNDQLLQRQLEKQARQRKVDMVVGSIDTDEAKNVYNAAFGITAEGSFLGDAYRKRYLVPFGEYTPFLVNYMPEWIKRLTNTPAGLGYSSGLKATILSLTHGQVAPLICFETISPELVASSVRAGGELVVNLSDLAWFHKSTIGEQMLAFAVLRAVENQRYFVFAANTGPSAIISPSGTISAKMRQGVSGTLTGKVSFDAKLTPFTQWCYF